MSFRRGDYNSRRQDSRRFKREIAGGYRRYKIGAGSRKIRRKQKREKKDLLLQCLTKLNDISGAFEGEHDFKAYCKSGSQVKTTVRKVYSVQVTSQVQTDYTQVEISVCGAGFLYNMVRTMAGTMLNYAEGSLTREDIEKSLFEGDRESVGRTLPAKGLTLESVDYDELLFV